MKPHPWRFYRFLSQFAPPPPSPLKDEFRRLTRERRRALFKAALAELAATRAASRVERLSK